MDRDDAAALHHAPLRLRVCLCVLVPVLFFVQVSDIVLFALVFYIVVVYFWPSKRQ